MNSLKIISLIIVLSVAAFGNAGPADPFVKDEVLVKIDLAANSLAFRQLELAGGDLIESLGKTGWSRVRIVNGKGVESAIADFRKLNGVIAVQPNFYYRLLATPNDPQWGATGTYGLTRISAPAAWDISTGSSSVVVANIDTGMRLTHEDLAPNIWTNSGEISNNGIDDDGNGYVDDVYGWDFRHNDSDPSDEHGHGTHVGGTIGAAGNNMLGVTGVNWTVRIMAIKIYSQAANDTTSAMLVNAYNYVRVMKERGVNIRVTNNSYGGCNEACGYDQATKDAIDALGNAGVLNVFAAGNNGQNVELTPFYPGSYDSPSILNVAASNSIDNRTSFSNYGAVSVDLAAPGAGILSTTNTSNTSYGGNTGTSMASPHVAGAAALLSALNPALSAASLKATLMNRVDPLAQWNGLVISGGRLNIFSALQNQTTCDFSPSVKSISMPTKGGHFAITVDPGPNCDFSAQSNVNWILLEGSPNRSGQSTINIRVTTNTRISRQGTLSIGGHEISISQVRGQSY